ncbi:MAG: 2-C-methyl-D-erythritol 4-phosphate cytidylyltransferase [Prevotella sp.]|nr:2-C-methyl-D-erythritol 4-phosphate cytidylyltransferase [Prevotella sp.]
MRNIAVILAGGKGNRMGTDTPKQFITVAGRTVIEHTIRAFDSHPLIDEIAVVAAEEHLSRMAEIIDKGGFCKVRHVLAGGTERWQSSLAAVRAYAGEDCNLLIHDGARPLVSAEIITACVEALSSHEAVEVAVPATDTIVELSDDGTIARIPPRRLLRNAQTPQCFRRSVIARAFDRALRDPDFSPTDDCSVVHRYTPEVDITVVEGDEKNIKITYKSDIQLLEKLLANK